VRPVPRSRAQRKADTLALLRTELDCWVASADEMGNAHLVPLSHYWDGAALVLATSRSSPTATNLLGAGVVRVGVGPTRDVVLEQAAHRWRGEVVARTSMHDLLFTRPVEPCAFYEW